ncbi:hypothetical protein [Aureibaculum conchae]|uniref:hypothetical protein n=1 Tax=Aureibaculum sp. 2308TA14-22 TaxID=3108392 RepID=UPI003392E09C
MKKIIENILYSKNFSFLQFPSNWLMQGIFHADKSEKLYKILFTVVFWAILFLILFYGFNITIVKSLIFGFMIAHTLNWFVNNNLFVLIVHRIKWFKTTKKDLFNQLYDIQERLEQESSKGWLLYSVSLGGICKGTLSEHSDIDVSLIRKPGFKNMVKAIIFYVKEKKYADLKGVPLDIFICDSPENCIVRSKYQKNPIVMLDHENEVDTYYPEKLSISIEEAMILNGERPLKNK